MPSTSIAQQHLFQATEHGADFPKARKLRASMSRETMHDFASGSEAGKPERVGPKRKPLRAAHTSADPFGA